jgi:hypothetical protein
MPFPAFTLYASMNVLIYLLGLFYSVGGGGFLSHAVIPKHIL